MTHTNQLFTSKFRLFGTVPVHHRLALSNIHHTLLYGTSGSCITRCMMYKRCITPTRTYGEEAAHTFPLWRFVCEWPVAPLPWRPATHVLSPTHNALILFSIPEGCFIFPNWVNGAIWCVIIFSFIYVFVFLYSCLGFCILDLSFVKFFPCAFFGSSCHNNPHLFSSFRQLFHLVELLQRYSKMRIYITYYPGIYFYDLLVGNTLLSLNLFAYFLWVFESVLCSRLPHLHTPVISSFPIIIKPLRSYPVRYKDKTTHSTIISLYV